MYGEIMIGVNLVFNYTVLAFANAAGQMRTSRKRLAAAAFAGALPAVIFQGSLAASGAALLLMVGTAFGFRMKQLAGAAGLVLMGALLAGGLLSAIPFSEWGQAGHVRTALFAGLAFAVLQFVKGKWLSVRQLSRLSEFRSSSVLRLFGRSLPVEVFIDTGNSCTEPLSNDAVHFVSLRAVREAIPETLLRRLENALDTGIPDLSTFPEDSRKLLRLIRIQTVDGTGWAVGIRFDEWVLEGGRRLDPGYIVLTSENTRYPHQASAILHVSALETGEERGMVHAT
ncbi:MULTISPECIES: sigma-E processing peptidase SpoIIGA [Sporosarcina]|uniref:sigma-E processing peptidase SpoIIGA n=1 Tax=Sporosarcina TaxID=1569 RepID=UPI00058E8789|nr:MULTISPECIES: sigma-E processing peptidase SpoIIGA [Sporosarcina]WJY28810.1 sigma-E processing peptidase SpoIIGA [Sporosarcina sp. 0.2-SM1T-5]